MTSLKAFLSVALLASAATATAAVSGRVVSDGKPVAGATVSAYAFETLDARAERLAAGQERRALVSVKAAADGTFRLDTVDPLAAVGARADGFAPAFATVLQGETAVVTLSPAASRRGVVTAQGRPVAGATMAWMANSGDALSAEWIVRTGADGAYEVPDPDRWATSLAVFHPDFALLLAGPSPKWAATHSLAGGTKVEGQVTDRQSNRGIAGATIWIDGWPRARSGADGSFAVPHTEAGWSRVTARTATMAGTAKKGLGRITIAIQPVRRLAGVVRDAATRKPLAGVSIRVLEQDSRATAGTAVTNAHGQYAIPALPPGRYWPYAMREGYAPGGPEAESIDVRKAAAATHDFALTPLRRAAGRVQDEQGRPVEGAIVTLGFEGMGTFYGDITALMEQDVGPVGKRQSASDGSFTLALPGFMEEASRSANLQAALVALKQGYAAGLTRLPAAGAPGPVIIVLRKGVALRGRVLGADGTPTADTAISVTELGPMFSMQSMAAGLFELPAWTRSDAEGRFAVHVNPARHQLSFRKPGYAPKVVDVADPGAAPELEVVLEPGAAVRGRVVRADGRGLSDATLTLQDLSTPPVAAATATSEADGSFALVDVAPGTYELQIAHGTGIEATRPVRAPAADLRIELGPTASIRGRVIDAATRAPVPEFWVEVGRDSHEAPGDDFSGSRSQGVSAADGAFVVEDVPVGSSTLSVRAEGYRTKAMENFVVSAEAGAPEIEVALEPGVAVRGRVTSDGVPLEDAQVSAGASGSDEENATTDENGDYEVKGLPPGEVTVRVAKDGHQSARRTVDAQHGARVDVSLSRGLSIGGIVVADDAGVPQANVTAHSGTLDADSQSAVTDAQGRFTLRGLSPGRYTVTAYAREKGKAEIKDLDVATAGPVRLVIDRSNRAILTGKVVGVGEGRVGPPPVVMVYVADQEEGGRATGIADGAGNFRIEDAPAGRVTVTAAALSPSGTRTTGPRELTLVVGSETSTVLEFKDDLVVTGTVTRLGAAVPNVSVSFQSGDDYHGSSATTDREGRYEIGLAAGTYNVGVSGPDIAFHTPHVMAESGVFDIDITMGGLRGRTVDVASQAPVAGAEVTLWLLGEGENTPASTLTTSAAGSFDSRSLREGRYRLVTSKKGYGQQLREVDVARGGTAEVLIELQPADGVTVTVTDARDGRPLEAIVVVRDAARRIVANRHAGADAEGAVTIPLADGAYLLSTSATGYGTATLPVTSPARGLRVGLTPGGTLVIESPRAIPGRIRLVQPDGEEYVRCWCNGIAEIKLEGRRTTVENVAAGRYKMELVDAPGQTFSRDVVIQEALTTTVAID